MGSISTHTGRLAIALAFAAALSSAQEYTITTVAGGGPQGQAAGDGGPAARASLGFPRAVAVDDQGNLYIADTGNNAVRKVSPDGMISTFAGGNGQGSSGDGGPATAAKLFGPASLALDSAGNLYIAEDSLRHVRRISRDGIIRTVAGGGDCYAGAYREGKAALGAYTNPQGIAVDSSGSLYISSDDQIRKVSPQGVITTVAGMISCGVVAEGFSGDGGPATEAKLKWPKGLAMDRAGNLYISDLGNARLRKLDTGGIITTIGGNGQSSSGGFMRSLNAMNGRSAIEIGFRPESLAIDSAGSIFIVDTGNGCVWVMTRDRRMNIIAGGGFERAREGGPAVGVEMHPAGIALGKRGMIYVAEADYGRVRMLTPTRPQLALPETGHDSSAEEIRDEPFTISALPLSDQTLSIPQIAATVAKTIADNREKFGYLLYRWELRAQFSGTARSPFPTFSQDSGEKVHTEMPAFRGHAELIDHKLVSVMDGWADQPPLGGKDLRRRSSSPEQSEPETVDIVQELLRPSHSVRLVGMSAYRGARAYIVESLPPSAADIRSLTRAASCAAGMKATVLIDAATFFPIRMDAEVVRAGMCVRGLPLDLAGTREQVHYSKVSRKDPCGDVREIWVMDEAVQRDQIHSDGYIAFPGQIAQRLWPLGPNYRNGEFKATTVRKDFQIFVTGSCVSFGEVVESKPVESVQTHITFDLNDADIPFLQPGSLPTPAGKR